VIGSTARALVKEADNKACEMPDGIPLNPNPRRTQKLDRMAYREVAQTLRNEIGEPDTLHLKNKGITIVTEGLKRVEDDRYALVLVEGQGILDRGHTADYAECH
jgi:hypothetical protein